VASGKRSPLTVAGAAVELDRNTGVSDSYHIPSSLSRMREAIKVCSTPVRCQVVNGGNGMAASLTAPGCRYVSIVAALVMA
jgi:hypothetical protein